MGTLADTASPAGLSAFDPDLLSRMTGELGDRIAIESRGLQLQSVIAQQFQAGFLKSTGLVIDVRPGDILRGRRRALIEDLNHDIACCDATIRGWSTEVSHFCGTKLVIALVECLLGGSDPDDLDVTARPLSNIELDMSMVVFEQLNDSLKAAVSSDSSIRASIARPGSSIIDADDDPVPDFHAVALCLNVEFGSVTTALTIVVSQAVLLKTKVIAAPKAAKGDKDAKSDWASRLSKNVIRSQVDLEARINLEPMRIGDISRLQPGDLLAFADTGDIDVTLGANGKDLFSCAMGRSGQRYMLRVQKPAGPDEDWKNDFA
ncbi:flagellar motor switch protein FliM [Hoeflea marina]|uniref:Flagellar motor switch protein FliM n=1 Tax=Hoeflea marina TaxID=274592 RepID=A0A317PMW2_9HYPH|nr:FliM/FliN family flagellar motor switch protein [Hoeflea marina]PWV99820.1 flagellar motor switch protein FliM [Hoeflea marina]